MFHWFLGMRPSRDSGSAPPLRSEEVPSELMCSICFGIPLRPAMVTPCEHVFCEGCIEQALTGMSSCPNCRMDCSPTHIRGLVPRSLPYRVWSGIAVKCPKHESGCGWTGSAIDAVGHMEVCTADKRNGRSGSSCLECDSIREENRELSKKVTNWKLAWPKVSRLLEHFGGTYAFNFQFFLLGIIAMTATML